MAHSEVIRSRTSRKLQIKVPSRLERVDREAIGPESCQASPSKLPRVERPFEGQVALVTGEGKGIGLAIARGLVEDGAKVAVSGRHEASLKDAVSTFGSDGLAVVMDVRDEISVRDGIASVMAWAGRLDILVNNAGIGLLDTPLLETTTEAWRDVLETNLTGAFFVTKEAWPHLVESKGQVLSVSSIAGSQGFPGASAYCASKHGLSGFTEVLRKEGGPVGVRALALCPGAVDTDIWDEEWASYDHRARMMSPDQIGLLAAAMLATPRNIDLGPWVVLNRVSPWAP